jgi:hypothetical protein
LSSAFSFQQASNTGCSDPAKHLTIIEAIRENRLDFVVILETG